MNTHSAEMVAQSDIISMSDEVHQIANCLLKADDDADQSVEELRSKVRASLPDAVAPLGKRRKGDGEGDGFSGGMVGVEL